MIGRLTGTLAEKSPPQVLVDVARRRLRGRRADEHASTTCPALGERVTLLTHFVVREDAQLLFGFLSADERATFRQLVKISGVGPRTALSILSGLSVAELAQAVTRAGERPPGEGARHRQEDRRAAAARAEGQARARPARRTAVTSDAQGDIVQALVALGYSEREAAAALKSLPADVA